MDDGENRDIPVRKVNQHVPETTAEGPTPWPLRIYTLGRFTVIRDGVPLKFERKAQKRPIELLQALIALGGRQVSQCRLEDALWPNANMDSVGQSFNMALHRLRKLIGSKCLVLQEGKLTLDPSCCWVDVWAFERQLSKAESYLSQGNLQATELSLQVTRAMDLCRGNFLGQETEQVWMISLREKLRHRVRRLFKDFGRCLGRAGQCQQVIAVYHKALEIDPLAEEFYRQLMICYAALGCHAETLATYHSCRKALQCELNTLPSPLTEAVLKSISLQERSMSATPCDACRTIK